MADLSNILLPGAVLTDLDADGSKSVLCAMCGAMAAALGRDKRCIYPEIMARERLGSTAVGGGVVIPHAYLDGLGKPVGGFALLRNAVDFDAPDRQPCDLIFMLLAPADSGAEHLRALAGVSRVLRDGETQRGLRAARTRDDILHILAPARPADAA